MKALNENRLSMAKAVQAMLNANTNTVSTVPALVTSKTELDGVLLQIEAQSKLQEQQFSAADKQQARDAAINAVVTVIAAAKAYALDQGKPAITASFNYVKTKLDRMRDTTLVSTLKLIKDNAELIKTDIAPYGADAAMITQLQTLTGAYEALLSKPKTDKGKKAAATAALDNSFKVLMKVMKKMDNMVATQQDKHKDFCVNYQTLRKMGNRKGKDDDKKDGGNPTPPAS